MGHARRSSNTFCVESDNLRFDTTSKARRFVCGFFFRARDYLAPLDAPMIATNIMTGKWKIKSDHYLHIHRLTPTLAHRAPWICILCCISTVFTILLLFSFFRLQIAKGRFLGIFFFFFFAARCFFTFAAKKYHFWRSLCCFKHSFVFKYRLFMLRLLWDHFLRLAEGCDGPQERRKV